jgi:hypothetical protein
MGIPLIRSLVNRTPDFSQSQYLAYVGLMGIHGAPLRGWLTDSAEATRKIVPVVKGVTDQRRSIKVVELRLNIGSDWITDLRCRLDADLSPELFKAVSGLPWPQSRSSYVFHQTYVINQKGELPPWVRNRSLHLMERDVFLRHGSELDRGLGVFEPYYSIPIQRKESAVA